MKRNTPYFLSGLLVLMSAGLASRQIMAGPPLICHPYEIGNANSLPWAGKNWRDVEQKYEIKKLADDTLNLLQPDTPIIVRMETLRRATIYAQWSKVDSKVGYVVTDGTVARQLFEKLQARARNAEAKGLKSRAAQLAIFDAGYYLESLKDAGYEHDHATPLKIDGLEMLEKASEGLGQPGDAEFAIAMVLKRYPDRKARQDVHLKRAAFSATQNSWLGINILNQFGGRGKTLSDLQASLK